MFPTPHQLGMPGEKQERSAHHKRTSQNQDSRLFLTFPSSFLHCHLLPPQISFHRGYEVVSCHTSFGGIISIITPAMPKHCPLFSCYSLISRSSRIASRQDYIQSTLPGQQHLQLAHSQISAFNCTAHSSFWMGHGKS